MKKFALSFVFILAMSCYANAGLFAVSSSASSITGVLPVANGGTGLSLYSSYQAFGDSITFGLNSTTPYPGIIGGSLGISAVDSGVSGAMAADEGTLIYKNVPSVPASGSPLYTYMIGTNDNNIYQYNSNKEANFQTFNMASASWLAIPNSINKFTAQSSGVTYGGTWTNSSYYNGGFSKQSIVNASTATATVFGSVVYVGYTEIDGNTGSFTVTIDGAVYGPYYNYGAGGSLIATQNGGTSGPAVARIAGLANITHTVVVTVTSGTGAGNVVQLDWIGTNAVQNYIGGPSVVLGGIPFQVGGYTDAQLLVYTQMVKNNALLLASDGLNVGFSDTNAYLNKATDFYVDGVHLINIGQSHAAASFLSKLYAANTPGTNLSSSYTSNLFSGIGTLVGVGTSSPNSTFEIDNSAAYSSSASNFSAGQLLLASPNGTVGQRTYIGSFFTGGTGSNSIISSSNYFSGADHSSFLFINPSYYGSVSIGTSLAPISGSSLTVSAPIAVGAVGLETSLGYTYPNILTTNYQNNHDTTEIYAPGNTASDANATLYVMGNQTVGVGTGSPPAGAALGISGHLGYWQAAVPVITACGSGTAATGSTDNKGQVTGITAATACTITFGSAMPTAPACAFSDSAGTAVGVSAISTAAVTASMTALTGTLYYICQ